MKKNRLQLDFTLTTAEERSAFVSTYLKSDTFKKVPPTQEELELMGDFVLWGKTQDGESYVQKNEIQIETRKKTWQKKEPESLEALLESPTFSENFFVEPTAAHHTTPRSTFSRKAALREAPPSIRPVLEDLFKRIDQIELLTALYDLKTGKRTTEIRPALLQSFTPEEVAAAEQKAQDLSQFRYLKLRHLLVELRREQYTIRDFYKAQLQSHGLAGAPLDLSDTNPVFEAEIPVFPLGIATEALPIFPEDGELFPKKLTESQVAQATKLLWKKRDLYPLVCGRPNTRFFDFRNLEHVYELFGLFFELEDAAAISRSTSTLGALLTTLDYYIRTADLTPVQKEILGQKVRKVCNQEIARSINAKYGKSYTPNYISTIFRQKIIPRINAAAARHEKIVENLAFPENFKKCSLCGKTLLVSTDYFMHKSRSNDGFSARCKVCDKMQRNLKKEGGV